MSMQKSSLKVVTQALKLETELNEQRVKKKPQKKQEPEKKKKN